MRRSGALACTLWLSACVGQAQPPGDAVFRVIGNDCRGREFLQSGFRTTVGGEVGIVTTLHGIVGCRAIVAENESERVDGLQIDRVDVLRDVAFLTSEALRTRPALPAGPRAASTVGRVAVPIGDLASPDQGRALADRRSPAPDTVVFRLASGSRPEKFGGPILDATGLVVGVENGVAGRSDAIGWVIAYQDIAWSPPVQNETEMDRLAALSSPLW